MSLDALREDIIVKQKKGLPFIIASVVIWILTTIASALDILITTKNISVSACIFNGLAAAAVLSVSETAFAIILLKELK